MRSQGKALLIILLILLLLGFVGVVAGLFLLGGSDTTTGSSKTRILEIDFTQGLAQHIAADVMARSFLDARPELREVVEALEQAAGDDGVAGLLAKVGAAPMGLATIQEVRDAVHAFGASGKKTVAYTDTFGEFGPSNTGYYLATAFDQIYLQPSGDVGLMGLLYQTSFLKGTLDKLGIEARMDHRYEYKNAMNSLTETEYTEPHAEAMQELVDSQFDQVVTGIGEGREIEAAKVREIVDRGPYFGQEALDAGLVDGLAYRDEVYAALSEDLGETPSYQDLMKYYDRPSGLAGGTTVALIYGIGGVSRGESQYDPLTGNRNMGAETISEAFRDAVEDPKVKAILFRVDSPGGSYVASDTIWHETIRAREAGKPVIVSFGNIAGSGGYFVAMGADGIVAQPGTITGSIGVYGGKLLNRELFSKLGVSFDDVGTSLNSRMWSSLDDFSETGWDRFQVSLDRIYEDFTQKVAEGRELPLEDVQRVAKGRIWTGAAALDLGLIDALGGYPTALALIREKLELEEDSKLRLKIFPQPKSTFEVLLESFPMVGAEGPWHSSLGRVLDAIQAVSYRLEELGLLGRETGALTAPEVPDLR